MPNHITATRKKGKEYSDNISFVIMAGGIPYGAKSLGVRSLYSVDDRTLIDIQVETIRTVFGGAEIIIVSGFESNRLVGARPNHTRIVENQMYVEYNEIEEMRLAINNATTNSIVFLPADCLFNLHTISKIDYSVSCAWIGFKNKISKTELGCNITDRDINHIDYGLENKFTNIFHLTGKELDKARQICKKSENKTWFAFEVLNSIIKNGGVIKRLDYTMSEIVKINKPEDLYENFNRK